MLMVAPLIWLTANTAYNAHASGFIENYNQAIVRNADSNGNGKITKWEELEFKQSLQKEISELKNRGKNFNDIVKFLEIR